MIQKVKCKIIKINKIKKLENNKNHLVIFCINISTNEKLFLNCFGKIANILNFSIKENNIYSFVISKNHNFWNILRFSINNENSLLTKEWEQDEKKYS